MSMTATAGRAESRVLWGIPIPPWHDVRWLQFVLHIGSSFVARSVFNIPREHWVAFGCLALGLGLDLLFGRFIYKKINFPLSAGVAGLGGCTLIYSPHYYVYWAMVVVAISSKALITYRGRHMFNPTNFALVVLLLLFPRDVTSMSSLFSGSLLTPLVFFATGSLTVLYARQALIAYTWIAGYLLFGVLRGLAFGHPLILTTGECLSPVFLMFAFHMITDPATTPRTPRFQIAFALTAALFDSILRELQVPNSYFFALFAVYPVLPWVLEYERNRVKAALLTA
jgi:Na+-translocating ferredoxin:NAD+ oxidoreductase RnfD subunit